MTVKAGSSDFSFGDRGSNNYCLPTLAELQTEAYQPVYLNKARYLSVTMMEQFSNYSFEEMRLGYFRDAVLKESIEMIYRQNGKYSGHWIPRQNGLFRYKIPARMRRCMLSITFLFLERVNDLVI